MPEIIYTSLIRSPNPLGSSDAFKREMLKITGRVSMLMDMISEGVTWCDWVQLDDHHVNIIRTFIDLETYQTWIYSDARNQADQKLMDAGWFLYTKQGHDNGIKRPQIASTIR